MHVDTLKFYKYNPVKKPQYKGKFCSFPWDVVQIDEDGDVMLCGCQLHMPYVIGNIYKDRLHDIWTNHLADQVRQSVLDGDFTYCNWACPTLTVMSTRPAVLPVLRDFPPAIKLDLDRSCNLKCPSCRESIIIEKSGPKIDKQIELYQEIVEWARDNPDKQINIVPVSSGEVFASHSGLAFLKSLVDYPHNNIRVSITTNGNLINRNKDLLTNIHRLIDNVGVSIDAATPETYAEVRGGDWKELMRGLEFVRDVLKVDLSLNFCIQEKNYQEIDQFANFIDRFGADINYQRLLDWGHWNLNWWSENNALDRKKSSFDVVLSKLKQVLTKYPSKAHVYSPEIMQYLKESP